MERRDMIYEGKVRVSGSLLRTSAGGVVGMLVEIEMV